MTENGDVRFESWKGPYTFIVRYTESGRVLVVTRQGRFEIDLKALQKEQEAAGYEPLTIQVKDADGNWKNTVNFSFLESQTIVQFLAFLTQPALPEGEGIELVPIEQENE